MSGPTEGPWMVEQYDSDTLSVVGAEGYRGLDNDRRIVCDIHLVSTGYAEHAEEHDIDEANARLIAAAPELLDVAEDALQALDDADQDRFDGGALTGRLRSAIAKAKGDEVAS